MLPDTLLVPAILVTQDPRRSRIHGLPGGPQRHRASIASTNVVPADSDSIPHKGGTGHGSPNRDNLAIGPSQAVLQESLLSGVDGDLDRRAARSLQPAAR